MRVPLAASDFPSYLLQALSSGPQVLALANAGSDFTNSLRAAEEFGLLKTMRPAALLAFIGSIHALGLETAQRALSHEPSGLVQDLNDKSRAFYNAVSSIRRCRADHDESGVTTPLR